MDEEIKIRQAVSTDLETLLHFEQAVIKTELPFDPTLKRGPNRYYDLQKMLDDPDVFVVVAEQHGKLIGSGYGRIENSKSYLQHRQHCYLGFMYVEPSWRGNQVNQRIIEALKQWAKSRKITELRLDVYADNLPAIKAYEKAGFKKLMMQMRMSVED